VAALGPANAARRPRLASPWLVIALAWAAAGVAQGFGRFTYALILPAVQEDLLGSYAVAGLLGTLNVAGYLLGTALVTVASTRTEPGRLIRIGLVGSTSGLALAATAPSAPVLALGMTVAGIGGAFIWVPAPGLVGSVVSPERRGLAVGVVGSGIGVGIVFASQLAGAVRRVAGDEAWRQVWAVEAGIAVVVLVAALVWLRPPVAELGGAAVRVSALREVPGWVGLTVGYATYGLTVSLFMSYLVAALEDDAGFTPGHAASVYAALGVSMAVGGVLVGRLSDRTGRRLALIGGYAAMGACPLLVLTGREPWALLSAVAFGIAMSGVPTVIAAHLSDTLHPRAFAAAFGALTLAFGVAQVLGPQLGGWLASRTGSFTLTFTVAATAGLVGAVASRDLPRPVRAPAAPPVA
jgi:predicted MFS family arabinose efflux permease